MKLKMFRKAVSILCTTAIVASFTVSSAGAFTIDGQFPEEYKRNHPDMRFIDKSFVREVEDLNDELDFSISEMGELAEKFISKGKEEKASKVTKMKEFLESLRFRDIGEWGETTEIKHYFHELHLSLAEYYSVAGFPGVVTSFNNLMDCLGEDLSLDMI